MMNAGAILERALDPVTQCLTPEAAHRILSFQVDSETQDRVNQLAERAGSGMITEEETQEYRELVDTFDLVALLKFRARSVISGDR